MSSSLARTVTSTVMGLMTVLLASAAATQTLPAFSQSERFIVLDKFNEQAVLDRTTQLVWERLPHSTAVTWLTATTRCSLKTAGDQTGWRLPTFIELMTLVEPPLEKMTHSPALPPGHPFQGVKAGAYWTINDSSIQPGLAYTVDLLHADVVPRDKTQSHPIWCVREGIVDRPLSTTPPRSQSGLI
jgi:hypothetical protein